MPIPPPRAWAKPAAILAAIAFWAAGLWYFATEAAGVLDDAQRIIQQRSPAFRMEASRLGWFASMGALLLVGGTAALLGLLATARLRRRPGWDAIGFVVVLLSFHLGLLGSIAAGGRAVSLLAARIEAAGYARCPGIDQVLVKGRSIRRWEGWTLRGWCSGAGRPSG